MPEVDGVLLLYHHFPGGHAPTIMDHVDAFASHSQFPVFAVNTDYGFPSELEETRFRAIVLHYSLFASEYYFLPRSFRQYVERAANSYKIAFFQDEMRFCRKRFEFLDRFDVDCVYTLLDEAHGERVYQGYSHVGEVKSTLPGYVSDQMVSYADQLVRPDHLRSIDIGYRARCLPFWMGRGAQEKHEIAERFSERVAHGFDLHVDIDTREERRMYGDAWYEFVADCRGMLGVEAGTSVFDLDGSARARTEALLKAEPGLDFCEVERRVLHEYEDRIPYRTLSPRHFEAAAFRVVQILFRGHYSGVLEPDVHYLALEKDFSNFASVMERFADPVERSTMTERAYEDLVASGRWGYASFVRTFDSHLAQVGVGSSLSDDVADELARALGRGATLGRARARQRWLLRSVRFPGRHAAAHAYRRLRSSLDRR